MVSANFNIVCNFCFIHGKEFIFGMQIVYFVSSTFSKVNNLVTLTLNDRTEAYCFSNTFCFKLIVNTISETLCQYSSIRPLCSQHLKLYQVQNNNLNFKISFFKEPTLVQVLLTCSNISNRHAEKKNTFPLFIFILFFYEFKWVQPLILCLGSCPAGSVVKALASHQYGMGTLDFSPQQCPDLGQRERSFIKCHSLYLNCFKSKITSV